MAKMQVLSRLENIICLHLKYAIDFEKVINIANKKKLGRFPGLLVSGLLGWLFCVDQFCGPVVWFTVLWSSCVVQFCGGGHNEMALLGGHRDNRPAALTQ